MSTFAIKLAAMILMVIDHTALALCSSGILAFDGVYFFLRSIGRPAFPLFCYLLAVGYEKTSNREKYLSRLCGFAVISQLPFCLIAIQSNYSQHLPFAFSVNPKVLLLLIPLAVFYVYVCDKKTKPSLVPVAAALLLSCTNLTAGGYMLLSAEYLNVFYTLAISLVCMRVFDVLTEEGNEVKKLAFFAAAAVLAAVVEPGADYALDGLVLAVCLHCFRDSKKKSVLFCAAWCGGLYLLGGLMAQQPLPYVLGMFTCSLAAPLMIVFYNEKRGPKLRTAFYLVYPVHLALIALVFVILR